MSVRATDCRRLVVPEARLLARVFRVDVTVCPDCGGTMKFIAALTDPPSTRTYLDGVGLADTSVLPLRKRPRAGGEMP
ncbi:MAG: hypothetical protein WD423_05925 [Rhodothermales bacterium]